MGFEATDFPFPPRFACHLRERSSGLSGDDTISLGTVRPCPPTPRMCRYSRIQMEPGYLPPLPRRVEGRTPIAGHPPGAASCPSRNQCSQSFQPSQYQRILASRSPHTHKQSLTGLQDSSPHLAPQLRAAQGGRVRQRQTGARREAERCRGARYTTRPRQDGGARPAPAAGAGASPQPQRSARRT